MKPNAEDGKTLEKHVGNTAGTLTHDFTECKLIHQGLF